MTMPAYAQKVVGDLRSNRSRTVLVALSVALGVAAVGMVVGARIAMQRSLDRSRAEGAFASATLLTDPFAPRLLATVRRVPGVADVQARTVVGASVGGMSTTLFGLPDAVRIARLTPWPPPQGQAFVERASIGALHTHVGALLPVVLPDGRALRLRVAGTVHDVNVQTTRTSGIPYLYVRQSELHTAPNELLLRVDGSRGTVEGVMARVRHVLERAGVDVRQTSVPKPGVFWATAAVRSMELLLTVLSVVCLAMSAFLVVNIVSSLVTRQTQQIGVMKAVGARIPETAGLYLATAALYGTAALVVAIPVAALGAWALVSYAVGVINLETTGFTLPLPVLGLELAAGLLLPLLAALGPVLAGVRITVREAIARRGLESGARTSALAERATRLPVALRLASTNALRRRRRLLLTLASLVVGGAVFVGVLTVRSSLLGTLHSAAAYRAYDVEVTLDRAYAARTLERVARGVDGVSYAEAWSVDGAYRVRPDGGESVTYPLTGVPAGSRLLRPSILHGRALRAGDRRAVVVNTDVLDSEPGLHPGQPIALVVNGRLGAWRVVGIARRVVQGAAMYTTRSGSLARQLVVVGRPRGLVPALQRHGFRVASVQSSSSLRALDEKNFGIIVTFLLVMAVLLALVGGLGLLGTLSLNVLDRSREIGVLRTIGAGDRDVMALVLGEGVLVAAVGWLLAAALSVPVGLVLSRAVGNLFLGAPLRYSFSTSGLFIWLGLVLLLAAAACLVPARRAARLTVRDVLAYE